MIEYFDPDPILSSVHHFILMLKIYALLIHGWRGHVQPI
jgi:hypothetical protein